MPTDLQHQLEGHDLLSLTDEILGEQRAAGWLRSLIKDGLLASPQNHGRPGRRGGRAAGTWSAADARLFVAVLHGIRRGQKRRELANLVVGSWLAEGSQLVSVAQLRRALRTYCCAVPNRRAVRRSAVHLAELLGGGPGISRSARRVFIDAFEQAMLGYGVEQADLTSPVFDPHGIGPGPLRSTITPLTLTAALEAWRAGSQAARELDEKAAGAARRLCLDVGARLGEIRPQLERMALFAGFETQRHAADFALLAIGLGSLTA